MPPLGDLSECIPPELLSDIFLLCVPYPCSGTPSERTSVISLSHVCQRWRSVALATSALWTCISFREMDADTICREVECARAWLSRSSMQPLSIMISLRSVIGVESALEVFMPHYDRWREFNCGDTLSSFQSPKWHFLRGNLPLLEEVNMTIHVGSHLGNALEMTPRLRRLKLSLSTFREPFSLLDIGTIPWHQITHLDVSLSGPSAAHEILKHAPRLETLSLSLNTSGWSGISNDSALIAHPVISSLRITGTRRFADYYMEHITLPALRQLSLRRPSLAARRMLERSCCCLKSLTFIDYDRNSRIISFLELTPALERLSLCSTDAATLEALNIIVKGIRDTQSISPLCSIFIANSKPDLSTTER